MIENREQLAPYCVDQDINAFAQVRRHSTLTKEIHRGRPHATMTQSGRAGELTLQLVKDKGVSQDQFLNSSSVHRLGGWLRNTIGSLKIDCEHAFSRHCQAIHASV